MKKTKSSWSSWSAIVVGFVAVTWGGFHSTAWSEDLPPPATTQSLEDRIKILEDKAKDSPTVKASGSEGFQIQSTDKAFALRFRGLFQVDSRQFIDDQAHSQTHQFLVRRARPILEAAAYGIFGLLFTPEFAGNSKTSIVDAYLDVAPWTFAKLRVGKFKPPIGLEHLQSDAYVPFAERGLTSNLVPNRDTGIQLFGDVFRGVLSYAVAFTNGVGDNNVNTTATAPVTSDTDNNDGKEGSARVQIKPFKNTEADLFQGLALGLGGSYARQSVVNPTYSSPGQISLLTTAATAIPDGEKIRIAPEVQWYHHALGAYAEYVQSSQVYRVSAQRFRVLNEAWQGVISYVLTGEDASYTGVKPRKPFDPKNRTWGAFEMAARYGQLYLDPDNFTRGVTAAATTVQRAESYGVGVNWYLNNSIRFSTGYDRTTYDKGASQGDRPDEKVVISRAQLLF